ncbi:MAG: MMPL family transporter [Verrucomicrobiota bacterium]
MVAAMRRIQLIVLLLFVVFLAVFGFSRIRFNVDVLDLLPAELPEVEGLRLLQDFYSREGELILTLQSKEGVIEDAVIEPLVERFENGGLVSSVAWRDSMLEDPEGVAEWLAYLWWNGKVEAARDLENRLRKENLSSLTAEAVEVMAGSMDPGEVALASYDPFGLARLPGADGAGDGFLPGDSLSQFVAEDGLFRALFLKPPEVLEGYREVGAWVDQVLVEAESWSEETSLGLQLGWTGEPAFLSEIARGMEKDMTWSIVLTTLAVALLFRLIHRRWRWLGLLLVTVGAIFAITLGLGGFLLGDLSAMSVGFAAILIGLAVDYAVILFREFQQQGYRTKALRKNVGPGILWAAVTTGAVFLNLNFSQLPGIAQLGNLVAIGIVTGAMVVLWGMTGMLGWAEKQEEGRDSSRRESGRGNGGLRLPTGLPLRWSVPLLVVGGALLIWLQPPLVREDFEAMRPRDSQAMESLNRMEAMMGRGEKNRLQLPLVVTARDDGELLERSRQVEQWIEEGRASDRLKTGWLPVGFWADGVRQKENEAALLRIAERQSALVDAIEAEGFNESATDLLNGILDHWRRFSRNEEATWPEGGLASAALSRLLLRETERCQVMGWVEPDNWAAIQGLNESLGVQGAYITGWDLLGPAVLPLVRDDMPRMLVPLAGVLLLFLGLAFRSWKDLFLTAAVLGTMTLFLLIGMRLFGWEWNFMNLAALALLFGTGLDYSIHMLLALKRHPDDPQTVQDGIGVALVFCGLSTAAGFASLGMASNLGLASLGQVCALGILGAMVTSVFLLPPWWRACHRKTRTSKP